MIPGFSFLQNLAVNNLAEFIVACLFAVGAVSLLIGLMFGWVEQGGGELGRP